MNNNQYHEKLQEYIQFAENHMYIFDVIQDNRSSHLIFMYKEENIVDLYNKILFRFGCRDIKALYYYAETGERVRINYRPTLSLIDLIQRVAPASNRALEIISTQPTPPVYRLFFEE